MMTITVIYCRRDGYDSMSSLSTRRDRLSLVAEQKESTSEVSSDPCDHTLRGDSLAAIGRNVGTVMKSLDADNLFARPSGSVV